MSRDTIVTDEEGTRYSLDNHGTQYWLDGHYSGLDNCVNWLNQQANELFAKRKTSEAVAMQGLADRMKSELRPRMVKRAEEHNKEHPSTLGKSNGQSK